jgi:hypothetical protein
MTDILRKPEDQSEAQANGADAKPIVIRKLDRLETTRLCFNDGG